MSVPRADDSVLEMMDRFNITCDKSYARRYCVTRRALGSGSFGKVYAAYRAVSHTDWVRVAVKEISIFSTDGPSEVARRIESVGRESALMYNSNSIRVVTVFQPWCDAARGVLCIPQELCDESLETFRVRHIQHGVPLDMLYSIFFQCLEVLQDLKRADVVHNDIKPANIMLVWEQGIDVGLPRIKLADFGLACPSGEIAGLVLPNAIGTPYFMAPESHTLAGRTVPFARDLWSMGCLFHLLLTGQYPFLGGNRDAVRLNACVAAFTPFPRYPTLGPVRQLLYRITRLILNADPVARPTADQVKASVLSHTAILPPPVLPAYTPATFRRMAVCVAQQPISLYARPERHPALLTGQTIPVDCTDVFVSHVSSGAVVQPSSVPPSPHTSPQRLLTALCGTPGASRSVPLLPTLDPAASPDPCGNLWYHVIHPAVGYCPVTVNGHVSLHDYGDVSRFHCKPAATSSAAPAPLSPTQLANATPSMDALSPAPTPHAPTPYNPKVSKSSFRSILKRYRAG